MCVRESENLFFTFSDSTHPNSYILHMFAELHHPWHLMHACTRTGSSTHTHTYVSLPEADETSQFSLREWLRTMSNTTYSWDYLINWFNNNSLNISEADKSSRSADGALALGHHHIKRKSFLYSKYSYNCKHKGTVSVSPSVCLWPFLSLSILSVWTIPRSVRPTLYYICTTVRHGWLLHAADKWPDSVCLGRHGEQ